MVVLAGDKFIVAKVTRVSLGVAVAWNGVRGHVPQRRLRHHDGLHLGRRVAEGRPAEGDDQDHKALGQVPREARLIQDGCEDEEHHKEHDPVCNRAVDAGKLLHHESCHPAVHHGGRQGGVDEPRAAPTHEEALAAEADALEDFVGRVEGPRQIAPVCVAGPHFATRRGRRSVVPDGEVQARRLLPLPDEAHDPNEPDAEEQVAQVQANVLNHEGVGLRLHELLHDQGVDG
mmetsp:Transcript_46752/g.123565  ORF Transcript_46752/g.123565 Transcript_46752/m.123565 type:complete len:231 (+) Transcript_46752:173-865(+)